MKQSQVLSFLFSLGFLFSSATSAFSLPEVPTLRAELTDDLVGIVIKDAEFWIGHPEEGSSMPFLKISAGGKVIVKKRDGRYYFIRYRDMLGYVKEERIRLEKPELPDEPVAKPVAQPKAEPAIQTKTKPAAPTKTKPVSTPADSGGQYLVTKETSLRTSPDSQAKVLVRLPVGGAVTVLESTGRWWWKVRYRDQEGWAKKALLVKD